MENSWRRPWQWGEGKVAGSENERFLTKRYKKHSEGCAIAELARVRRYETAMLAKAFLNKEGDDLAGGWRASERTSSIWSRDGWKEER